MTPGGAPMDKKPTIKLGSATKSQMEESVRYHLLQAIFEAEMATDFIEKMETPMGQKKDSNGNIDISTCTDSEQFLDMVAH
jgi:hypothetical protein